MKLIEAIKKNNEKEVFKFLKENDSQKTINEVDPVFGGSPLYWAVAHGYIHFIKPLVLAGANVNKPDKDGKTPVFIAAQNGHAEAIDALKATGANMNTPDKNGETPIYVASVKNHVATVAALKASGANMNIWTKGGVKPLDADDNTSKMEKREITNNSSFSKLFLGLLMVEEPDLKSSEEEYQSLVEKYMKDENISRALTEVDIATTNAIKTWGCNLARSSENLMSYYYTSLNKSDSPIVEDENELTKEETELLKIVKSFNMEILHVTQDLSERERELLSLAGIEEEELNSIVPLESPDPDTGDHKFDSLTAFGLQQRRVQENKTTRKVVVALELEDNQDVIRRTLNKDAINRANSLGRSKVLR
jgi:hypothetical protein